MRRSFVGTALAAVVFLTQLNTPGCDQPQVITNVTPDPSASGTTITITGEGFEPNPGLAYVTYAGVRVPFTVWSDTRITATIPAGMADGTYDVTVVRPCPLANCNNPWVASSTHTIQNVGVPPLDPGGWSVKTEVWNSLGLGENDPKPDVQARKFATVGNIVTVVGYFGNGDDDDRPFSLDFDLTARQFVAGSFFAYNCLEGDTWCMAYGISPNGAYVSGGGPRPYAWRKGVADPIDMGFGVTPDVLAFAYGVTSHGVFYGTTADTQLGFSWCDGCSGEPQPVNFQALDSQVFGGNGAFAATEDNSPRFFGLAGKTGDGGDGVMWDAEGAITDVLDTGTADGFTSTTPDGSCQGGTAGDVFTSGMYLSCGTTADADVPPGESGSRPAPKGYVHFVARSGNTIVAGGGESFNLVPGGPDGGRILIGTAGGTVMGYNAHTFLSTGGSYGVGGFGIEMGEIAEVRDGAIIPGGAVVLGSGDDQCLDVFPLQ